MMWEKVKIKDITINLDNRRKPLNEQERNKISKKKLYPYIGANNIMDYVDEYLFDEEIICIAEDGGSWGENQKCVVYFSEKCWVNNHAHVLSSNGKSDLKYLMYYLNAKDLTQFITGSTRGKLTKSALDSIQIPLPPLPIQKRIAEILDTADALRRKDEALLKKYDELAQAIFIDLFGDIMLNEKNYPIFEFGKLCEELFLGLTSKVDYVNSNGVPLIRATDINKGELSFKNVKFISQEQHKKLTARRITRRGDVLISKSGTLGTCAIVDTDEEFSTYESIFTVRPKKELLSNVFLVSLVRNPSFQEKLLGGKVGAGVAHLNLNMLRDFTLPLPPIELQDKFASISKSIENLIKVSVKSKTDSESLFYSLLQKAFNGELVA